MTCREETEAAAAQNMAMQPVAASLLEVNRALLGEMNGAVYRVQVQVQVQVQLLARRLFPCWPGVGGHQGNSQPARREEGPAAGVWRGNTCARDKISDYTVMFQTKWKMRFRKFTYIFQHRIYKQIRSHSRVQLEVRRFFTNPENIWILSRWARG